MNDIGWMAWHVVLYGLGVMLGVLAADMVQKGASRFYWEVWRKPRKVGFVR